MDTKSITPADTSRRLLTIRDVFSYSSFTRPGVLISGVDSAFGPALTDRYVVLQADVLDDTHQDTDILPVLFPGSLNALPRLHVSDTIAAVDGTHWYSIEIVAPLLAAGFDLRPLAAGVNVPKSPTAIFEADKHIGYVQTAEPSNATGAVRPDGRVRGLCHLPEAAQVVALHPNRPVTDRTWIKRLDDYLDTCSYGPF